MKKIILLMSLNFPFLVSYAATAEKIICPSGYTAVELSDSLRSFCISTAANTGAVYKNAVDWDRANLACNVTHTHLCSASEWQKACSSNRIPHMDKEPEWVSNLVNRGTSCGLGGYSGRCAFVLGGSSCNDVSSGQISYDRDEFSYRCCTDL